MPSDKGIEASDPFDFVPQVVDAFAFLETDYGFVRVRETPELVRYERGPIGVDVIREAGVNVLVGRRARLRDGVRGSWRRARSEWGVDFPIEYLAEAVGDPEGLSRGRTSVHTREEVAAHVGRLAQFLRRHGGGLLTGEDRVYRKLAAIARRRSRELTDWASGKSEHYPR